jgi:hypothetical protein
MFDIAKQANMESSAVIKYIVDGIRERRLKKSYCVALRILAN